MSSGEFNSTAQKWTTGTRGLMLKILIGVILFVIIFIIGYAVGYSIHRCDTTKLQCSDPCQETAAWSTSSSNATTEPPEGSTS